MDIIFEIIGNIWFFMVLVTGFSGYLLRKSDKHVIFYGPRWNIALGILMFFDVGYYLFSSDMHVLFGSAMVIISFIFAYLYINEFKYSYLIAGLEEWEIEDVLKQAVEKICPGLKVEEELDHWAYSKRFVNETINISFGHHLFTTVIHFSGQGAKTLHVQVMGLIRDLLIKKGRKAWSIP